MIIKDRMSKNVLTVEPSDSINKAIDIMESNGLHRLPVVEDHKLVGLITKGMITSKGASKATSLSIFELNYLLSKTNVKTIMEKEVHTILEDDLLEDAAVKMLNYNIGCLPVVDDNKRLVGIITQNDLFKSFIDLLGYGDAGSRVCIQVKEGMGVLERVTKIFTDNDLSISHIGVYDRDSDFINIIVRVDKTETKNLVKDLESSGYKVLSITENAK